MFSKNEIREFVIKLGRRWFFPDFSNKLTWTVISLGVSVILVPAPLKLAFYNWLVDTVNLNAGKYFSLAELGSGSADYWVGFALILSAFAHNIASKWIKLYQERLLSQDKTAILDADRVLFGKFMAAIPSDSPSIYLLKLHDFGDPFTIESLNEINTFVSEWNCAESKFLNEELEHLRAALWQKIYDFRALLAEKSAPISKGCLQSVVPEQHRNDWTWPKWVADDIQAVNSMASEVFELHQSFIFTAKRVLMC